MRTAGPRPAALFAYRRTAQVWYLRASSSCSGLRVVSRTLDAFTIFPSTGHCIRRTGPRCTEPNKRDVSLDMNR